MLTLCSFLRGAYLFVKSLVTKAAKSDYRSKAVFLCAGFVVAVTAFTAGGFGGGGRNALTVFAETSSVKEEDGADEPEEIEIITEADIRIESADRTGSGRQVVGSLLAQELKEDEENRIRTREEIRRGELEEARRARIAELQRAGEAAAKAAEERALKEAAGTAAEETAGESRKETEEASAEQTAAAAREETSKAVSVTGEDYQVLLRIVQAEAGICDEKGRILVANVILNRVRSDEFPDTVRGVVYQRSQFSPVADGSIDTCKVTQETVSCVDRALSGEDYSQGALYFMNRRGSSRRNASWFDSHLTYLFSHDRHEFFK